MVIFRLYSFPMDSLMLTLHWQFPSAIKTDANILPESGHKDLCFWDYHDTLHWYHLCCVVRHITKRFHLDTSRTHQGPLAKNSNSFFFLNKLRPLYIYIYIYIIIIIKLRWQSGLPWPSLFISMYHPLPPTVLSTYILYPHRLTVNRFSFTCQN